jgi:hypothetical protein
MISSRFIKFVLPGDSEEAAVLFDDYVELRAASGKPIKIRWLAKLHFYLGLITRDNLAFVAIRLFFLIGVTITAITARGLVVDMEEAELGIVYNHPFAPYHSKYEPYVFLTDKSLEARKLAKKLLATDEVRERRGWHNSYVIDPGDGPGKFKVDMQSCPRIDDLSACSHTIFNTPFIH